MTINDAATIAESYKPNAYEDTDLIRWLSQLDWKLKREIIDKHEGGENVPYNGYDTDTDKETELLAPPPYDEMYIHWIHAQINFYNSEYARYQASIAMHNAAYASYAAWYNENHMPKQTKFTFFGRRRT